MPPLCAERAEGVGIERTAVVFARIHLLERRAQIGKAQDAAARAGRIERIGDGKRQSRLEGRNTAETPSAQQRFREPAETVGERKVIDEARHEPMRRIVR